MFVRPHRDSRLPGRRLPAVALALALVAMPAAAQSGDPPARSSDAAAPDRPASDASVAAPADGEAAPSPSAAAPASAAEPPAAETPATDAASTSPAASGLDAQKQRMETLETDMQGSAAEQARLAAELETLKGDRAKLASTLIETAARARDVEDRLDASEQRLAGLEREEADIRDSLDSRRAELAQVLGGLVRLGRRPPPALLVRPDDALQSVRSAMLLGAVLPELKSETDLLASELTAQERVRRDAAAERDALAELKEQLGAERRRIAALIEERQRSMEAGEAALGAERARAATLAAQAGNVRDLVTRMETEIAAARKAAEAARRAEAVPAKASPDKAGSGADARLAALGDAARLTPGVPFGEAKGLLPLPTGGTILRNFGGDDGFGGAEKGVMFGTRAGAQVASPSDGWVVYAGPFRSYGQLLIINAGGGYHILLAGMDRITVELGQFVLSGEPVGVMGDGPRIISPVGHGTAQPILYVEFRKDGTSIDPTPWWVTSESEKARG